MKPWLHAEGTARGCKRPGLSQNTADSRQFPSSHAQLSREWRYRFLHSEVMRQKKKLVSLGCCLRTVETKNRRHATRHLRMQSGCTDHPLWSPVACFQPKLSAKEKRMVGSHPLHRPYVNMSTTSHHENDTRQTTLLRAAGAWAASTETSSLGSSCRALSSWLRVTNNSPQEKACSPAFQHVIWFVIIRISPEARSIVKGGIEQVLPHTLGSHTLGITQPWVCCVKLYHARGAI